MRTNDGSKIHFANSKMEEEKISFKMVQLNFNETMLYKHLFYLLNKKVKGKTKTVKHFFAVSNRSNGWK
jgi:hypothetical protein